MAVSRLAGVKMWQLYCQDGAAGAEFRQLQSSQGAVRAWAWNMSRMLMRHLATQPQPLALSADCQPPLLDSLRSLHPILTHTLSRSARSASVSLKIINMQCNGCSGGLHGGGHLYIILSNAWTSCFHVKHETLDDLCHELQLFT